MKMLKILTVIITGFFLVFSIFSFALDAEEVYGKVNKSVYTLYTVNFYEKQPESLGSAIAVTDHILATNCHVALTGNYLGIVVNNEFRLGTLFFRDLTRDICFVEIPGVKFTPVKMRKTDEVHVGEQVFAIGSPEGLDKTITQGIVSNKQKDRGGYILQTDANVSFGSSGGGLFDKNGNLVGLTFSVDKRARNIAFAIPTEWISQILFPKAMAQNQGKEIRRSINLQKVGSFGQDDITLYRVNDKKCFLYLKGKNEFGDAAGSAIWYPERPNVILFLPRTQDIKETFQILNKVFYQVSTSPPMYSHNFLSFGDKKYDLVGVKDDNGRFPVLVTKLPDDVKDKFTSTPSMTLSFQDNITVQGFSKIQFGLSGFNEALTAYNEKCKQ